MSVIPPGVCGSTNPETGRHCQGPEHHALTTMCGNGDERWWHPSSGARDAATVNRRELDDSPRWAHIAGQLPWLDPLVTWALSDDDAVLDFAGMEVPARLQMLLGRAFSDVADLIGREVTVTSATPWYGSQPAAWTGTLTAIHRDATGAPYALALANSARVVTFPWLAIAHIEPAD